MGGRRKFTKSFVTEGIIVTVIVATIFNQNYCTQQYYSHFYYSTPLNYCPHQLQQEDNQKLIDAYVSTEKAKALGSPRIRRHSTRDARTTNKVQSSVELLKLITTPKDNALTSSSVAIHRYNAFFKYALDKCGGNLERAILMVTSVTKSF
jgi:hypothetical protein|tara:strand:- start:415 stop:864 length:450 start_codon:yes stop_codon:yes gene_type:complete